MGAMDVVGIDMARRRKKLMRIRKKRNHTHVNVHTLVLPNIFDVLTLPILYKDFISQTLTSTDMEDMAMAAILVTVMVVSILRTETPDMVVTLKAILSPSLSLTLRPMDNLKHTSNLKLISNPKPTGSLKPMVNLKPISSLKLMINPKPMVSLKHIATLKPTISKAM